LDLLLYLPIERTSIALMIPPVYVAFVYSIVFLILAAHALVTTGMMLKFNPAHKGRKQSKWGFLGSPLPEDVVSIPYTSWDECRNIMSCGWRIPVTLFSCIIPMEKSNRTSLLPPVISLETSP
jgi:hypothetical protein